MVFALPVTASAYNTYVGLKIESVNNPGALTPYTPTTWCLPGPGGVTTMTIKDGDTPLNTVHPTSDTCPGDTIWSGLVTLASTEQYTIYLSTWSQDGEITFHDPTTTDGVVWSSSISSNEYCLYCVPGNCPSYSSVVWYSDYTGNPLDSINHDDCTMKTRVGYGNRHAAEYITCNCYGTGNFLTYSFTFTAPAE